MLFNKASSIQFSKYLSVYYKSRIYKNKIKVGLGPNGLPQYLIYFSCPWYSSLPIPNGRSSPAAVFGNTWTSFKNTDVWGVPIMMQRKQIWLGAMRLQVRSLASLSKLRIQHCCELWCKSQTWLRSVVAQVSSYSSNSTPSLGTSICHGCGS